MSADYSGTSVPTLNNSPASSWTSDAAKKSHVNDLYLVTGSGASAGNLYAFEEYAKPLVKNATPGEIVTFTDGGDNAPITSASVSLSPIQSGSGDPSPTNIRPISGHTGAELKIGATYPTADNTYSVTFADQGTVYGGTFDFVSGKLRVMWASVDLGTLSWASDTSVPRFFTSGISADVVRPNQYVGTSAKCSHYKSGSMSGKEGLYSPTTDKLFAVSEGGNVSVKDTSKAISSADFKTAMSGVQLVYELATPIEIDLTPTEVETLLGVNNVWGSGPITQLTYTSNQFTPSFNWFETWTAPKITRDNGQVIVLPKPQEYTPEIYDVDASTTGRNAAGTMIRDRVARKHKFNYKFAALSQQDATEILNAVQDVSFTLTTASPETGAKTNYRVYVGDRSLPVYWMPTHAKASWMYSSLSLNLIEM